MPKSPRPTSWTCGACGADYDPFEHHHCADGEHHCPDEEVLCSWAGVLVHRGAKCPVVKCDGRPGECPYPRDA